MTTKIVRILILGWIFGILLVGQALPQQKEADFPKYMQAMKHFMDDFRGYAESYDNGNNPREFSICTNLLEVVSTVYTHSLYLHCLFSIYQNISIENEKNVTWKYISVCIPFAEGDINTGINQVNRFVSSTRIPAVAATGDRLKAELRKMKNMLESLK